MTALPSPRNLHIEISDPVNAAADSGSINDSEIENTHDAPTLPLLESFPAIQDANNCMTRSQAFNLYTTHFLSTWNVRTYEFAAVSSGRTRSNTEEANGSLDHIYRCSISRYSCRCFYTVSSPFSRLLKDSASRGVSRDKKLQCFATLRRV